ncbi:F-box domain containing protein [Trema orientale]|uniref:F-box domain containing protein n=1 Tax=Trema orientale TaxID=63057 RepID=A0A2P5A9L7_TREOI|nr:F-box domain containing protein [Trema orientale]
MDLALPPSTADIPVDSAPGPDWAGLPEHLLDMIFRKLELLKDCLLFSFICPSWHCVAKDNHTTIDSLSRHQVPVLLVHTKRQGNNEWNMYDVMDNKFSLSKLVLPSYDRPFSGSSEGWILTIDMKLGLTLYKPFVESIENTVIHLPPLFPPTSIWLLGKIARYREYYVMKMTTFTPNLLANPRDLILVVIFGECRKLAYIRPAKDSRWTCVLDGTVSFFDDVVYHENKFYAITTKSALVSFDVTDLKESKTKLVIDEEPSSDEEEDDEEQSSDNEEEDDKNEESDEVVEKLFCYKRYLVESFGDLLQVKRYIKFSDDRETKMFKVFKWNLDDSSWVEINSLGDSALFLGDNTSVSVLASTFAGCQKNSIYFTNDKDTSEYGDEGPMDLGVYNLETGICSRGFTFDAAMIDRVPGPQPIWVLPTSVVYGFTY